MPRFLESFFDIHICAAVRDVAFTGIRIDCQLDGVKPSACTNINAARTVKRSRLSIPRFVFLYGLEIYLHLSGCAGCRLYMQENKQPSGGKPCVPTAQR